METKMKISALSQLTIEQLTREYRAGSLDPLDVMECTLAQAAAVNERINALYGLEAVERWPRRVPRANAIGQGSRPECSMAFP